MNENEVEGLDSEAVEANLTDAAALSGRLFSGDVGDMDLAQLATACAEADAIVDDSAENLKRLKARLDDARKTLAEKMTNASVSSIRVGTTAGRKLVHLTSVFAPSVPAAQRPAMLAWLKANHPEMVGEAYVDATLRSFLKKAKEAQEGEFPQELVEAGVLKVYEGVEVRFRKSG